MFKRMVAYLVLVLALGLPFHGVISVFLPDCFRFWKEVILAILLGIMMYEEVKNYLGCAHTSPRPSFERRGKWAILFLLWGSLLILLNEDKVTALIAFRYLGIGFLVYLIFSSMFRIYGESFKREVIHKFSKYFIGSCVVSVLFGTCAKFLGGYEVLKQFYSTTISSWVPGQTLPLYHEAGGLIRMQGGSSGPIEFSHLLLGAVFLSLYSKTPLAPFIKGAVICVLLFGIYQSYSRAALLALLIGVVIWLLTEESLKRLRKGFIGIIFMSVIGGGLHVFNTPELQQKLLERGGSSDHITRPIEAFEMGIEHPLLGNLGALGPAARAKNLSENNDDKAPIAENVFVDYFAQLGMIGLVLAIGFFVSVFWKVQKQWWPFIGGFLIVTNLATVFDMTPLAITFFIVLSFIQKTSQTPVSK